MTTNYSSAKVEKQGGSMHKVERPHSSLSTSGGAKQLSKQQLKGSYAASV